jgi:rhodanese-related sulfurtransferase
MTATVTDPSNIQTISPDELKRKYDSGDALDLIDVRTPVEYRGKRITVARNVPLDTLDAEAIKAQRANSGDQPLYVVCHSGGRSRKACEVLLAAGVAAICIEGGTPACEKAGVPTVSDQRVISLERQVRIAAGSLVASGVLLGVLVNPWFLIVPGFVGCGLVFAGVTDWCGMGMLLAKMPWNR